MDENMSHSQWWSSGLLKSNQIKSSGKRYNVKLQLLIYIYKSVFTFINY